MKMLRWRLTRLTLIVSLLGAMGALLAAAAPAASAAPVAGQTAWVRIAHLSPEAPGMDLYTYAFGDPPHTPVVKDVSSGAVSSYMAATPGQYTVAMRGFGAPATSKPALTTSFEVSAGAAYTLDAIGPDPGLRAAVV